jgi:hypothetical protein
LSFGPSIAARSALSVDDIPEIREALASLDVCPKASAGDSRALLSAFWSFVVVSGVIECWINRNATNTDGISYLDVASAFARHDWSSAINAYWSPLYPFLLSIGLRLFKPAAYWEFTVVHFVNFFIFLGSAAAFQFFLSRFMRDRSVRTKAAGSDALSVLPEWAMRALGYSLFLWCSLKLTPIAVVSPDMTVALFVYLAAGIVIGMRAEGRARIWDFTLLGLVLGLGYLAKAPMLPVGIVFLAIALYLTRPTAKAVIGTGIAALAMILVAAPFVVKLSHEQGHLTWGDSARLNYAWYVNYVPRYHWQGAPSKYGTPVHPTSQVFTNPTVFAFDGPQNSTYPIWFDPTYWTEGVRPVFDWKAILRQVSANALVYEDVVLHEQGAVVVICVLLFLIGSRGKAVLADFGDYGFLLVPVIAAFGMYAPVHVEERMIAAYLVLFWIVLFATVRYRDLPETRRCASLAAVALALFMVVTLADSVLGEIASHSPRELLSSPAADFQWQVANDLHGVGVKPGDKVAWIRPSAFTPKQNYTWARLARVKIVAEVPTGEEGRFWEATTDTRSKIFDAVAHTGASAFVVTDIPAGFESTDWKPLGATGYYVHLLR